jgi:hypothetical protein
MAQQSPRRIATTIWAALIGGATMFLGVALYVVFGLRGGAGMAAAPLPEPALIGASLALSVVTVALTRLRAVRMASARVTLRGGGGIPPGPEADAVARLVLACALCEGGALAAIVVFELTGNALALAPYALSWLALAAQFPGDRHWAQLTGLRAGAARNPMIRG